MSSSSSSSNFLDEHLIINIVSRLPVESVFQCRYVCKTWRALFHELYFTQMHAQQQQHQQRRRHTVSFSMFADIPNTNDYCKFVLQDYYYGDGDGDGDDAVTAADGDEGKLKRIWNSSSSSSSAADQWVVVGSINGLICFYYSSINDPSNSFSIFNPVTREYLELDLPSLDSEEEEEDDRGNRSSSIAIGFGYHPSTNEYKFVRIIHSHRFTTHMNYYCDRWVQIYTLGTGTRWRVRKEEMGQTKFSGTGVYVNSSHRGGGRGAAAIYWLDPLDRIVSFDLEDENFRIILPPTRCIPYQLGELAGEEGLCVIEPSNFSTNIYILNNNNDGDNKYSWSKKYSIPAMAASDDNIQYKPIAVTRRGRVLCLCNKKFLISFDPSTETIESLDDITCFEGWSPIVSYIKSFVSLKSLGEEDAKIMETAGAAKKKRRRRSIDMKTEMIKLFASLLQHWFVE